MACLALPTEYTDPGMFIPKNTRVMVRKINAKVQSSALKDAPDKAAQYAPHYAPCSTCLLVRAQDCADLLPVRYRMAATAAKAAPAVSTGFGADDDMAAMKEEPNEHEEEGDEVARLQAMMEEQNNEWMK